MTIIVNGTVIRPPSPKDGVVQQLRGMADRLRNSEDVYGFLKVDVARDLDRLAETVSKWKEVL